METTTAEAPPKEAKSRFIKDFNPIDQWDQVAASMIYRELAPKGFKKYQSGHWKGAEHADIPFLSKRQVGQCQKIAAQLVRTFRSELKAKTERHIVSIKAAIAENEGKLFQCRFWEYRKRRELVEKLTKQVERLDAFDDFMIELDKTSVPAK
jgi:hypothetical protein